MNKTELAIREAAQRGYVVDIDKGVVYTPKEVPLKPNFGKGSKGYGRVKLPCSATKRTVTVQLHRVIGYAAFGEIVFAPNTHIDHTWAHCSRTKLSRNHARKWADRSRDTMEPTEDRIGFLGVERHGEWRMVEPEYGLWWVRLPYTEAERRRRGVAETFKIIKAIGIPRTSPQLHMPVRLRFIREDNMWSVLEFTEYGGRVDE